MTSPSTQSSHPFWCPLISIRPAFVLASSPERDCDIQALQTLIRNCAAAGIPSIKYGFAILGVLRTQPTPGRGDAMYSTWGLKEAHPNPLLTRAGRVDADMFWERITCFLERVIPVADEYKIRMACHPHDPGVPPEGHQGVVCVLGTVDGLKRFITIKESPYHGLNFCQGTVSELLNDPGQEIYDVIRYFGAGGRRSSTCTSGTSAATATIFRRSARARAISTSSKPSRFIKRWSIPIW